MVYASHHGLAAYPGALLHPRVQHFSDLCNSTAWKSSFNSQLASTKVITKLWQERFGENFKLKITSLQINIQFNMAGTFSSFFKIFLETTEKQSWRVRAGWEFIQMVRGWNETTADFRLSRHRTAVAAFSPQLLPQASHAMRLTELSVSLSVQVQHEWWMHHLHWLQKRLLLFIPYPLARGGKCFYFFYFFILQFQHRYKKVK